jgi:hypothetical protein
MIGEGAPLPDEYKWGHPMIVVLRERNFRWLWIGEGISTFGTQFYRCALSK